MMPVIMPVAASSSTSCSTRTAPKALLRPATRSIAPPVAYRRPRVAPIYRFAWWSPSTRSPASHREPILESCSAPSFRKRNSFSADREDRTLGSRRGSRVYQGRHGGGAHVRLDARLQVHCRGAVEPLCVDDAADDLRPGAGLGEALNKTEALGLGRLEAARRREDLMRR